MVYSYACRGAAEAENCSVDIEREKRLPGIRSTAQRIYVDIYVYM